MATTTKPKTTAKNAAKSNTTKRTSSSKGSTRLLERDPKVIAVDAAYALAGLANDARLIAGEALDAARHLPKRVRRSDDVTTELEQRLMQLRDRAEDRFDSKAAEGRSITDDVLKNPQFKRVLEQAKTARSQVKAAITSVRRTATRSVEAGVTAGRKQAETARSQVKGAATSVQKTAGVATDAVTEAVGNGSTG